MMEIEKYTDEQLNTLNKKIEKIEFYMNSFNEEDRNTQFYDSCGIALGALNEIKYLMKW